VRRRREEVISRWSSGCGPRAARGTRGREKAAQHGHLEVIKWTRANDCPWATNTTRLARRLNHVPVLWWQRLPSGLMD
jgi:hypothetical protein